MKNIALTRLILNDLARVGVGEVIVCAGARNAPFVALLSTAGGVAVHAFFEERSAAFFAVGRIAEAGRPVAVITTSGTAASELLSAVIEADYRALPLIVVTADRPRRYRGTGAPQTIVQPGLFASYVEACVDVEGAWDGAAVGEWSRRRPLHLNVCFDEPLLDEPNAPWTWPALAPAAATPAAGVSTTSTPGDSSPSNESPGMRPLVIVGGLSDAEAAPLPQILARLNRPIYAEGASQLRGHPALRHLELRGGDPNAVDFDSVVRIGQVPTLRLWRDLERRGLPVAHFSSVPLSGLPGGGVVRDLRAVADVPPYPAAEDPDATLRVDRHRALALESLLIAYPRSEPAWVRRLSSWIPPGAHLFLGNSLPIREWDLAAAPTCRPCVFANRGANGIDGLISTFAGTCAPDRSNWCLIGDLSTLYDLSGPWAWRARPVADVNIVVINNGGGRIFERMFKNPLFENRHGLGFADWARMWGLDYVTLSDTSAVTDGIGVALRPRVVEIKPDDEQTAAFWRDWDLV